MGYVLGVVLIVKGVVFVMNSLVVLDDFYWISGKGKLVWLILVNVIKLVGIDMLVVMWFNFKGVNDDIVWGYVVKLVGSVGKVLIVYMVYGGL